ncbi:MAG: Uma2 family endonuclease [Chloroflexota bacterium]|nr:Uma2 family endonuclease [Chloroflexota bacterium]
MTISPRPFVRAQEWPEQGEWTYEDWLRLPDDGTRYEVINGVLHMTPAPSIAHQDATGNLYFAMKGHADVQDLGKVFIAPVDVRLPGHPVPFEPDILFIRKNRTEIIGEQEIEGVPDLVVEVLSPSNWYYDRKDKFEVYRGAGVQEYWIVDYRAKTIEVFVLDEGEYVLLNKWGVEDSAGSRVLEGFQVAVADVFRR